MRNKNKQNISLLLNDHSHDEHPRIDPLKSPLSLLDANREPSINHYECSLGMNELDDYDLLVEGQGSQTQQLDAEGMGEQSILIKICDGIYLGNFASLTDEDSLQSNYMTHMVKVVESEGSGPQAHRARRNQSIQMDVSETIQFVHVHTWHQQSKQINIKELEDLKDFFEHAKSEGESCLVVFASGGGVNNPWMPLIPAAAVVGEYLMLQYHWCLLKTLDFINNRLSSGFRTQEVLREAKTLFQKQHSNQYTEDEEDQMFNRLLQEQKEQIPRIPSVRLESIQKHLMATAGDRISYNWSWDDTKDTQDNSYEEMILRNTFLNSSLAQKSTYLGILKEKSSSHLNNRAQGANKKKQQKETEFNRSYSAIIKNPKTNRSAKEKILMTSFSAEKLGDKKSHQQSKRDIEADKQTVKPILRDYASQQTSRQARKDRRVGWRKDLVMGPEPTESKRMTPQASQSKLKKQKSETSILSSSNKNKIILSVMQMIRKQKNPQPKVEIVTLKDRNGRKTKGLALMKNSKNNKSVGRLTTMQQLRAKEAENLKVLSKDSKSQSTHQLRGKQSGEKHKVKSNSSYYSRQDSGKTLAIGGVAEYSKTERYNTSQIMTEGASLPLVSRQSPNPHLRELRFIQQPSQDYSKSTTQIQNRSKTEQATFNQNETDTYNILDMGEYTVMTEGDTLHRDTTRSHHSSYVSAYPVAMKQELINKIKNITSHNSTQENNRPLDYTNSLLAHQSISERIPLRDISPHQRLVEETVKRLKQLKQNSNKGNSCKQVKLVYRKNKNRIGEAIDELKNTQRL